MSSNEEIERLTQEHNETVISLDKQNEMNDCTKGEMGGVNKSIISDTNIPFEPLQDSETYVKEVMGSQNISKVPISSLHTGRKRHLSFTCKW